MLHASSATPIKRKRRGSPSPDPTLSSTPPTAPSLKVVLPSASSLANASAGTSASPDKDASEGGVKRQKISLKLKNVNGTGTTPGGPVGEGAVGTTPAETEGVVDEVSKEVETFAGALDADVRAALATVILQ